MEKRTDSPYPRLDRPVLAVIGLALVASTVFFAWSDRQHDYKYYQYRFERLVREKFGEDEAAGVRAGLQQIWVKDLGRADRCVTCHQGITWKGMETEDEPYRMHPVEPLKVHAVERFGCSVCHGGQGWAVDVDEAHGEMAHWEEPLLGSVLGEEYSLVDDRNALMQMNCNRCHRYDRETGGAAMINHAKVLVHDKGCRACHVVNGRGGAIGPDLTFVGDKAPEQYEYGRLLGHKTAFAWHVAHFKDPRALVPDSVMPNFNFTTKDAQALSMLVLSWRRTDLPAAYVPGAPRTDPQTAEEREAEERMRTGPGAYFVQTGCFVCHSVAVYGVRSPAQIGPDLSIAVADVQSRFGRTVDDFFMDPTGTMAVVLARQIVLTPEQRREAIGKLREAYAEYERMKAAGTDPLAVGH